MNRLIVPTLATLVMIGGCGNQRHDERSAQPKVLLSKTQTAPTSISESQVEGGDVKLPSAGMAYAEAKALLLRQGLKLDVNPVRSPDPNLKELDCTDQPCRALFIYPDKSGWGEYLIVEVDQHTRVVSDARWPLTVDGLPSIPPSTAPDIPALPGSYWKARKALLALGFMAVKAQDEPLKVCSAQMEGKIQPGADCEPDMSLPEIESCSGTGMAFCAADWLEPKGQRVLRITTIGEPQPGNIYNKEWASKDQLNQLPADWRPH